MAYKTIIGFGALAAIEATYGAGGNPSPATDGIQGIEPPTMQVEYAYDGERPTPPGTAGRQALASPVGEHATGSVACEMRGAGVAYTSSITPPNIHPLLRASGFTATFDDGTWRYRPTPIDVAYDSATLRVYTRQERFDVRGMLCDYEITMEDGSPGTIRFDFDGLPVLPVDETIPAITYNSTLPPSCTDIQFQLGDVDNLVVRNLAIQGNREKAPRLDLNAVDGHAGFAAGRREPLLTATVEATPLATFDPHQLAKDKTVLPCSFVVGSQVGNRWGVNLNVQVMSVQRSEDGPVATWDLELAIVNTTPFANDDIELWMS